MSEWVKIVDYSERKKVLLGGWGVSDNKLAWILQVGSAADLPYRTMFTHKKDLPAPPAEP